MAPEGQDFWLRYGENGIQFIKVMEEGYSGPANVGELQDYAEEYGLTHPHLADNDMTQIDYVVTGYPTFVILDQQMNIRSADLWPWDEDFVVSILEEGE